jgi:F0F1-type ATP synthase membrane subunit b/b'
VQHNIYPYYWVFNYFGQISLPLNNIIYSNRRYKMEFSTVVVIVLVAAIGYVLYKAFAKKADTNQDGVVTAEEAKAEVKAEVAKVEEEVKVVATKAKTAVKATATRAKATVKKATTRAPRKTAAK